MNVVYDDRVILRHSGSADTLIHRNAHMLSRRSAKWSQDKRLWIVGIEHVESRPVVVGQASRNNLDDEVLQRREIA